jgi:hypothetical protein
MMTDIWCFTCRHEIRQKFSGVWLHVNDDDEANGCPCVDGGEDCQP